LETLKSLFLEAKWFYNFLIADIPNKLNGKSEKLKEFEIKTPNGFEKRKLKILGSQIKQGIADRIRNNLKALKKAKDTRL
jgi:putative transposase